MSTGQDRLRLTSQDRFARHRLIEGFSQDLVACARIAVIGAGAIGNELVKNLLLMGIGALDVYDFDQVELSNLTRSVFLRESDIGMNKAEALVDRARELHPSTQLRAFSGPISRSLPLTRLAAYDMVIAAVDNIEARLRLNDMALLCGSDWMNVAIDARSAVVELFPFQAGDTACYACSLPASVFERIAARYSCGGLQRAAMIERKVPTTAITASSAAALACSEMLRYLHQKKFEAGRSAASGNNERSQSDSHKVPFRAPVLFGGYRTDSAQRVYLDTVTPATSRSFLRRASAQRGCPGCGLHQRAARLSLASCLREALHVHRAKAGLTEPNGELTLSDALIMGLTCRHCGATSSGNETLKSLQYRRASDQDERILKCPACGQQAIETDIRERMDFGTFAVHFAGALPDCAWIRIGSQCFDLLAEP